MAGAYKNSDVTWTANDGGCNYTGFFISFSGQEKYVETTSSQTTIENIPGCNSTDVIVSFGLPTGEKFGTTAQTVATPKPEPQKTSPFNVVPGFTMDANLFPNKTIIVSYDASPGCGSFTKFTLLFGVEYTNSTRNVPPLVYPISEPKGKIEIGTKNVTDICLTSLLNILYNQATDGENITGLISTFFLPLSELGRDDLYPYEIGSNDVVFHWPTNLTAYDVCGVLPGTTLSIVAAEVTYMVPISNGTITLTNLAPELPTYVDVIDDTLGINLNSILVKKPGSTG
ncbi:uncharacterized protein LOC108674976 [Hyalella azteca]|uniref:Uncharacterized protein LOC108674976 n=1 Tax=Hyalella azteca TaxID=294128 RepID=A0A8B7NXC8_HYAAZ|nr:uncharacterized protein LOC108674976 [Hyalella azteca]